MRSYFENLDVKEKILGVNNAGWLQLSGEGEDEKLAINYLKKKIGFCPAHKNNIKKNSSLKGKICSFHENKMFSIDIGVFNPKILLATISLEKMQEQLMNNKKTSLARISTLFGLTAGLPINIDVLNIFETENQIEAKLSDFQLSLFMLWQKSLLDRLIIIGATRNQIKKTLKLTKLAKDVIGVESLGLFEQVLTCKLGTDAVGLIARIGRTLKTAKLKVFNPKKIHLALRTKPQLIS
jgi:hypothetical protein